MINQVYAIYNKNSERHSGLFLFNTDKEASYTLSREFARTNPPEALSEFSLIHCATFDDVDCVVRSLPTRLIDWDERVFNSHSSN